MGVEVVETGWSRLLRRAGPACCVGLVWEMLMNTDNSMCEHWPLVSLAFMKPVQTAQEEDACSCQFPEEEEGGCEL